MAQTQKVYFARAAAKQKSKAARFDPSKNAKISVKPKKRDTKTEERALVRGFIAWLQAGNEKIFVEVDQDSPLRVNKSGWDFQFIFRGVTVYVEAKKTKVKREYYSEAKDILLRPHQLKTCFEICEAGGRYMIFEFRYDGSVYAHLYSLSTGYRRIGLFLSSSIVDRLCFLSFATTGAL
jgi:hypothetical protein